MQGVEPEGARSTTLGSTAAEHDPFAEAEPEPDLVSPAMAPAAVPAAETPVDPTTAHPLRWLAFTVVVALAFAAVVIALNGSLYSASGFVQRYLEALQRRDVGSAVTMAGVSVPDGASTAALTPGALDRLGEIRVRSDEASADGTHEVTVAYRMGGEARESTFTVEPVPALFGIFTDWSFVTSPIVAVEVAVQNGDSFTVDGASVEADADVGGGTTVVAALTPSILALGSDDRYFTADPVDVVVTGPQTSTAALTLSASAAFVDDVQGRLDAFLDECVTQQVLLPAECPFGKSIENRVLAAPVWTMVAYPQVRIDPGPDGSWEVPAAVGTAHISVPVQSLFDGTTSTLEEDVPFDVSYRITVGPDRVLTINAT